jgi:Tfp pilus assembly protein PilP
MHDENIQVCGQREKMRRPPSGFTFALCAAILFSVGADVLPGWTAEPKKPIAAEKSSQPAVRPVAKQPAAPQARQPAVPAAKTPGGANPGAVSAKVLPSSYRYSAKGKADPFKPFMETDIAVINRRAEELKKKLAVVSNKAFSPLQKEDVGKFHLAGITGDRNKRTAIVEDKAAKKHYPLFIGTYIGRNNGRVAAILDDRVIVEEIVGDWQKKKTKKRQVNRIEMFLHRE